jgi:tetratricopeptide (TPR) repeat protein
MRLTVFAFAFVLIALSLCEADALDELQRYSDAHDMFRLRDALNTDPHAPNFYAGEVACAFNQTATCEEKFRKALHQAKSINAEQVHRILAAVALREGRYKRALRETEALLALDPNDGDAKSTLPLLHVLGRFADQAEQGALKGSTRLDDGKLPILINGKHAAYFFDTGANLSVLSESEAVQFGMDIEDVKTGGKDISGNDVSFRIGLAKSFAVGDIQMSDVAFLVSRDDQQPFVDMKPGERGLIGLPVLRALGSVTWTRQGAFEADRSPASLHLSGANICFDDLYVIARARFQDHELPFILDTGAATSELWPKFAGVAADLLRKSGVQESHSVIGMGGSQQFEATSLPEVTLELGGMPVALKPAHVLKVQQRDSGKWFYGNLGIDLLNQAESVTLNFTTMTLTLNTPASGE